MHRRDHAPCAHVHHLIAGGKPGAYDAQAVDAAAEHHILAHAEADVGKLASNDKWTFTEPEEGQRVWTDDYSNVLGAVLRRLR